MEYQNMINLLDNTPNPSSKFTTITWFEISNDSCGTYNTNSQIIFKTAMLKSSLCDYSDVYIHVKGTIAIPNIPAAGAATNNIDKKVIIKSCTPFTDCISEINNTQVDNANDFDVVISICNLIEYSDNHSKTSGSLLQYCSGKPAIDANGNIIEFTNANAITNSFKLKERKTDKTENDDTKDFEILVPLKYLSNFERILEMALMYSEVNLLVCKMFYSSWYCSKTSANIYNNSYKLYALIVTLSTQDNGKLLQQLKSGFKNTIKWNKYRSKVSVEKRNQYLDHSFY